MTDCSTSVTFKCKLIWDKIARGYRQSQSGTEPREHNNARQTQTRPDKPHQQRPGVLPSALHHRDGVRGHVLVQFKGRKPEGRVLGEQQQAFR